MTITRWPVRLCGTTKYVKPITIGGQRYLYNEAHKLYAIDALRDFVGRFPRKIPSYCEHQAARRMRWEVGTVHGPATWHKSDCSIRAFFEPVGITMQEAISRSWLEGDLTGQGLSMVTVGFFPKRQIGDGQYSCMEEIYRVESVDFCERPYMGGQFLPLSQSEAVRVFESLDLDDPEILPLARQRLATYQKPKRLRIETRSTIAPHRQPSRTRDYFEAEIKPYFGG